MLSSLCQQLNQAYLEICGPETDAQSLEFWMERSHSTSIEQIRERIALSAETVEQIK